MASIEEIKDAETVYHALALEDCDCPKTSDYVFCSACEPLKTLLFKNIDLKSYTKTLEREIAELKRELHGLNGMLSASIDRALKGE